MIRFNIEGRYLDLYSSISLQFKRDNILFAFDNIQMSRSTEFSVPATANNNVIFDLANSIENYGTVARKKLSAQLQYSGGMIDGNLYLTSASSSEYKCVFVFGELSKLKTMKESKISELINTESKVILGEDIKRASDTKTPIAFDNYYYMNVDSDYAGDIQAPNPSFGLVPLAYNLAKNVGLQFDYENAKDAIKLRLTVPQPKSGTGTSEDLSIVVNNGNAVSFPTQFFAQEKVKVNYRRNIEGKYGKDAILQVFNVLENITISFADDFPTELFLIKYIDEKNFVFLGDYSWGMNETIGEPLSGKSVNLHAFDKICFATKEEVNVAYFKWWGIYPHDISYTAKFTYDGNPKYAQVSDVVRMSQNYPDMAAIDLFKLIAVATNTLLYYKDETLQLVSDVDRNNVYHLQNVIKEEEIRREFNNYAQRNVLEFKNESYVNINNPEYTIINDNLESEKKLQQLNVSLPATRTNSALILDVTINDEGQREYPAKVGSLFMLCEPSEGFIYGRVLPQLAQNPLILDLVSASTSISVQAVMTLYEFNNLSELKPIIYKGMQWMWTTAEWQSDVVKLTLSKLP